MRNGRGMAWPWMALSVAVASQSLPRIGTLMASVLGWRLPTVQPWITPPLTRVSSAPNFWMTGLLSPEAVGGAAMPMPAAVATAATADIAAVVMFMVSFLSSEQ